MKQMIAMFLTLLLLVLPFGSVQAADLSAPVYGDASGDGTVSAEDALLILQSVVGKIMLTEAERDLARVTAETGNPDANDALEVLQYVVGKIRVFSRFGETVTVEKFYQIPNAKGSGSSYSFVDLIETYEQYEDLIKTKKWQAEEVYTTTYFQTNSLLVFNSTTYFEFNDVTILSAKRENDTLFLEIEEHYYGETKGYPQNKWYGVQIQKLHTTPSFFQIKGIERAQHQTITTTKTYWLPNAKHGMLTKIEVGTMEMKDLPPVEVAAYWADGSIGFSDIFSMLNVENEAYERLHYLTYDRFVPIVIPVAFGNLGCTANIGDYQIDEGGSLTLDVTLEMRLGAEVEQNSVYVLWLEYDCMVDLGSQLSEATNWLSVTVKQFDENNQPAGREEHYYKPFWSPVKTTAINNISFEMVEADASLKSADSVESFAPFEHAGVCHSYEEYLQLLDERILDESATDAKPFYANLVSQSDFDDGKSLVVLSSVWNHLGYDLTPVTVGMNSLFGDTLYLGMELYTDESGVVYEEEQNNLCFVWVNGQLTNNTKLSVDTRRIIKQADSVKTETVHQDFDMSLTE